MTQVFHAYARSILHQEMKKQRLFDEIIISYTPSNWQKLSLICFKLYDLKKRKSIVTERELYDSLLFTPRIELNLSF